MFTYVVNLGIQEQLLSLYYEYEELPPLPFFGLVWPPPNGSPLYISFPVTCLTHVKLINEKYKSQYLT